MLLLEEEYFLNAGFFDDEELDIPCLRDLAAASARRPDLCELAKRGLSSPLALMARAKPVAYSGEKFSTRFNSSIRAAAKAMALRPLVSSPPFSRDFTTLRRLSASLRLRSTLSFSASILRSIKKRSRRVELVFFEGTSNVSQSNSPFFFFDFPRFLWSSLLDPEDSEEEDEEEEATEESELEDESRCLLSLFLSTPFSR